MTVWQTLLIAFGGQVGLLAALAYLLNKIISHRLSQEAEAFKVDLQARANIEIERLKSSLQVAATENQIRFSKLHDRRALVIARLYRFLLEARDTATFFAAHPKDATAGKEQWDQHLKLHRFFHVNKIYFPSALCGLLDNYESKLRLLVANAKIYMRIENPNPEIINEQNKSMLELWRALEKDFPTILSELEKEFRSLLGVELKSDNA